MALNRNRRYTIEWAWSMKLETTRVIRGVIYTIAMGLVTSVVVVEGATELNVAIGVFYIIGALLVFGVDINRIELGPLIIDFESTGDYDNDN
jgi:hypothetical protein